MEKLIFRKFILDVFSFFIISSFSITLIVWIIQAVNYLDFVSEDGHSFRIYFLYTLLTFPKIYGKIVIFSFFISIFYILSKYEDNNEILIYWTHGITRMEFINNILKFSFFILILQVLLNFFLIPKSLDKARSFIRGSNIDYLPSLIKPKQFIDTVEDLTIFVERKDNDVLENILLKDKYSENSSQIISAKKGFLKNKNNTNYLVLLDGKIINVDENNSNIFKFDKTEFNLSKHVTKTTTYPKIQEIDSFTLIRCFKSFLEYNKGFKETFFSCDNQSINPVLQELFKRTFGQIYIFITSLIAGCLLIYSKDNFKYNLLKLFSFFAGIAFVVLAEFNIQYVNFYSNLKFILLILPILIFFIIYLILMLNLKLRYK